MWGEAIASVHGKALDGRFGRRKGGDSVGEWLSLRRFVPQFWICCDGQFDVGSIWVLQEDLINATGIDSVHVRHPQLVQKLTGDLEGIHAKGQMKRPRIDFIGAERRRVIVLDQVNLHATGVEPSSWKIEWGSRQRAKTQHVAVERLRPLGISAGDGHVMQVIQFQGGGRAGRHRSLGFRASENGKTLPVMTILMISASCYDR